MLHWPAPAESAVWIARFAGAIAWTTLLWMVVLGGGFFLYAHAAARIAPTSGAALMFSKALFFVVLASAPLASLVGWVRVLRDRFNPAALVLIMTLSLTGFGVALALLLPFMSFINDCAIGESLPLGGYPCTD